MIRILVPAWSKRFDRFSRPRRGAIRKDRRSLEALETRQLLSFAAPVSYNVGTKNTLGGNGFGPQVIAADFNGDHKLDLAVTNSADGTVNILKGNGDGSFQPAVAYSTGSGSNPYWMAAVDFNGDGKLDLAVEGVNQVIVLLGNGDGTFAAAKSYTAGSGIRGGLAVGDFFGNGRQDIAVVGFTSNNIQILPSNGDGTFGAPIITPMPSSFHNIRSIVAGNFFGNGHLDIAVAGNEGYNNVLSTSDPAGVALFENDGSGHFTYKAQYAALVTPDPGGGNGTGDTVNPEHVDAADLNGDAKPDLVVSLYDHDINVFINNGDGTFQPAVAYTTETSGSVGGYPRGVAFGDFNGDGKIDIATLDFGQPQPVGQPQTEPGSIGVLYGNGDGTFQDPIQYTPYVLPGGVAVGDFNGDGLPDLAVAQNYTGHAVGVMLNQPNTAQEPPTVTGVSPGTGPTTGGNTVTIIGTNFTGTTAVDFGTVPALNYTVTSDNSITATAPAGATGTDDVTVYNAGASAPNVFDDYTYQSAVSTETWTGLGSTSNWSDPANWSANIVPGPGTTVVFDSTSTKNATVDSGFAGTVAAVEINTGYSGSVTLNEALTVSSTFIQNAGTYNANGFATTVTGVTTLNGGNYETSTAVQTLTGGLNVAGGTFTGSSGTVTVGSLTLSSGTLNAPSGTLNVTGGNITYTGGAFNADLGTVTYTGNLATPTVSVGTGQIAFNNFTDALTGGYPAAVTITGTLTVNGTFTWKLGSGVIYGNIEARGDVDDQNHGGTGNPYLTLDGTSNQTIKDTSTGGTGGIVRTLTINKPSGTVILASNLLDYSNFTMTAGMMSSGPYSLLLGGQGPVSAVPGVNVGNIGIDGASIVVSSANLQAGTITFEAAGDKLTAPTGNLSVSGDWNNTVASPFVPNGGTVVFDGTSGIQQLTSGGQAFNNLTVAAGATVKLDDNLIVNGVFTNNGTVIPFGPPTVSAISPATGPSMGGTIVTLTGTNYYGTTQVDFGGVPALLFKVNSNTSITATAPPETAGPVDVTVFNASTSAKIPADVFTYIITTGPTVTGVSPAVGSTSGGTVVTITGTNFLSGATVKFGGLGASSIKVNSATSITATAPPDSTPGVVDVTVTTTTGTSATSSADHFAYQAPVLTTISVSPLSVSLGNGFTQQFSATAIDQFGKALPSQPAFTWSITGVGSISGTGLYTAPKTGSGTAVVKAASGSLSGTASVTVKSHPGNDFLGNGVTDPVIFRRVNPGLLDWFIKGDSSLTGSGRPFGAGSLDIPLTGDFDGDGKADLALYRPSTGNWYVQESGSGYVSKLLATFGAPNVDIPVPADYNGTGTNIPGVYRPTTGQWFLYAGGSGKNITLPVTFPTGASPMPGDYDNVGKAEAAVYNNGQWLVESPGATTTHVFATFGGPADIPVPGAYDALASGNLALEAAVWRPGTGQFFIHGPTGNRVIQFAVGDIPAPGDYDGVNETEAAVYRPSTGQWLVFGPSDTSPRVFATYGGPSDVPSLAPYLYRALKGGSGNKAFSIGPPTLVDLGSGSSSSTSNATVTPVSPSASLARQPATTAHRLPAQAAIDPLSLKERFLFRLERRIKALHVASHHPRRFKLR